MIETGENQVRFWKGPARDPLEVSIKLVEKITKFYSETIDENGTLDIQSAVYSSAYDEYLDACAELVKVNLDNMTESQKIAFFLNVYQCMYVHYFILKVKDEEIEKN